MPLKPKDPTREFLEEVRRFAAERRGETWSARKRPGRPSKKRDATFFSLAECVAKYRDAGLSVRPKDGRRKSAISETIKDFKRERMRVDELLKTGRQKKWLVLVQKPAQIPTKDEVREAWETLGYLFKKKI